MINRPSIIEVPETGALIGSVADELLRASPNEREFSKFTVIFPNKRPIFYLIRELSENLESAFIPPNLFSINEFVNQWALKKRTGFRIASEPDQIWILFNVLKKLKIDVFGSEFRAFYLWGRKLAAALNEIEMAVIPEARLNNLYAQNMPEKLQSILSHLGDIRTLYNNDLTIAGLTTTAVNFSSAANSITASDAAEYGTIFICGFFEPCRAEQKLLDNILSFGSSTCFISKSPSLWNHQNITIHSAHDTHSQVKIVGEILTTGFNSSSTAILLPDSGALIPLLSEVMGKLDSEYNISLGYPLSRSALHSFFESIIQLQESRTSGKYYLKNYYTLMNHPYIRELIGESQEFNHELFLKRCGEHLQKSFVSVDDVELLFQKNETLKELHALLITKPAKAKTARAAAKCLKEVLSKIYKKTSFKKDFLAAEFASGYLKAMEEFGGSLFSSAPVGNPEVYELFRHIVSEEFIPFSGVPLSGIQILGMLETRNLRFEKIIVFDVNEGLVPGLSKYDPILPEGVRKLLGLSTYSEREVIFRRNFMSLVSGAREAHLIYKIHGKNTRSRYIEEIIWEKEKQEGVLCQENQYIKPARLNISVRDSAGHCFEKTPETFKILSSMRFSPSGIDVYLHCPSRFYFNYVLGLKEQEKAETQPDAANIGVCLHEILEEFYRPFVGKSVKLCKRDMGRLEKIIEKKIADRFGPTTGEIYLMSHVIKNRLSLFFERERERKNWKILATEKKLSGVFNAAHGRRVLIGGIIDRVDLREENVYIVDYKSGGFSVPSSAATSPLAERENMKKFIKSFQLPIYMFLYNQLYSEFGFDKIRAVFYSLKDVSEKALVRKEIGKTMNEVYLPSLVALFSELFDKNIPFKRDDTDDEYCGHCPYSALCHK